MVWKIDYVQKNKFSRPGTKLDDVDGIIMHWTGNKGATDEGHQDFFDGSDGGGSRYAGAHLFIDKDSSTLIIPLDEVAYHANDKPNRIAKLGKNANFTTIGVELCVEKDGTIHPKTIDRAVQDVAKLCKMFKLTASDIYRHYDVTHKNCPAPWVANPSAFTMFKVRVAKALRPKPTALYHIVKARDSVSELADKYHVTIASIVKLNNLKANGNLIFIGQKLRIK